MSKRPSNEKAWCFVCERTVPARDAEPVMRGDIVKKACISHGLGLRSTPPKADTQPTWTAFTGHCEFCKRDFHVSQEAIDEHRKEYPADTEEVAAAAFTACMSCAAGRDFAGEHDFSTPKKRPTIIVYMSGELVEDVVSDMDIEVCPFIYTVQFNTAGQDESEYSIELDMPQHSGDNPLMKREDAFCYEWQGRNEPAAIARLEEALARVHEQEVAAEAIGGESAVPQHTPINEWRMPPKQDDLSERVERVNVEDLSAFISDLYSNGEGQLRDRDLEKLVRYVLTESERTEPQALPEWTLEDQRKAEDEGWCLFNYPDANTDLEKDDEAGRFVNDDEALLSVARRARHGSAFHRRALAIWRGLNPTEYDAAMKAVGYPRISPVVTTPATYPQGLLGECDD